MTVDLFFKIRPKPKQSFKPFINKKTGRIQGYQKGDTVSYENDLAYMARQQIKQKYPGFKMWTRDIPVHVTCLHFAFEPLKGINKKEKALLANGYVLPKTTKPDLPDNLSKAIFDAMAGIVFEDDCQIISMNNVKKYYAQEWGIHLKLYVADDAETTREKTPEIPETGEIESKA